MLAVPQRDGKVSVQTVEKPDAPFLIRVRDYLAIRGRGKAMAPRLQLGAQLDVVVDLAVLHRPVAPALARERLVPESRSTIARRVLIIPSRASR